MQQVYKKYGMAIPCYVQSAGTAVAGAPTDATDSGLERIVRTHLAFADFAIWRGRMTQVEGHVCRIMLNGAARGTGFLVGPDDHHAAAEAVRRAPALSRRACRERAERVLDIGRSLDAHERLYERVAGARLEARTGA